MDNQQDVNNYNLMKVIGLGVLMILLLFSFFTKKENSTIFGIPNNAIYQTDSTSAK